jgi:hypothetical protein
MSVEALFWSTKLDVPIYEKMVAIMLADHANGKAECWPSKAKIAKRSSCSKGQVTRSLKLLEEWGLVEREARFHDNGKPRSNKYTLRLDRVAPPCAMDGSQGDPTPEDDEENDDETTSCNDVEAHRVTADSIPRSHTDTMGRTHDESMDGVTQTPTNRNNQLEPPPLTPKVSASGNAADKPTPVLPDGKAAGSAGKEKGQDPDSEAFKRSQFDDMVTNGWQQLGLIGFAGEVEPAFQIFRKWPFELREEARVKAPNYGKAKKAEFAAWNNAPRDSRASRRNRPAPPTVKDFCAHRLFQHIGSPVEPPPPAKAPPVAWCEAIAAGKRTKYDETAVFVQYPSEAFSAWLAAYRRAGCGPLGYRAHHFQGDDGQRLMRNGDYFASEYPPAESEFEQSEPAIEQQRVADGAERASDRASSGGSAPQQQRKASA